MTAIFELIIHNWTFFGRGYKKHGKYLKGNKNVVCCSFNICGCKANVECMIGYLINKPVFYRQRWVSSEMGTFLDACSSNSLERQQNEHRLKMFIIQRSQSDLYDMSKTIDIDVYFNSTHNLRNSFTFLPWVGMFIDPVDGRRIFLESEGISINKENVCFVFYNGMQIILDTYKKLTLAKIPNSSTKGSLNPDYLIFKLLKISGNWVNTTKRRKLVKDLSIHYGALTYDSFQYSNHIYNLEDRIRAKKKLCWNLTSNIPFNVAVHIGLYPNLDLEHQNSVYPDIVKASEILGLCKHKIVYAVFSSDYEHEGTYLLNILDFDLINKANLIPINTSTESKKICFLLFLILKFKKRIQKLMYIMIKSELLKWFIVVFVMGGSFFIICIIKYIGFNPSRGVSSLPFASMSYSATYSLCLPRADSRELPVFVLKRATVTGSRVFKSVPSRLVQQKVSVPSKISIGSAFDLQPRIKSRLRSLPESTFLVSACTATVEPFLFVKGYAYPSDPNTPAPVMGTWNSHLSVGLTKDQAIQQETKFSLIMKQYIINDRTKEFLQVNPNATASEIQIMQEAIDDKKEKSLMNRAFLLH